MKKLAETEVLPPPPVIFMRQTQEPTISEMPVDTGFKKTGKLGYIFLVLLCAVLATSSFFAYTYLSHMHTEEPKQLTNVLLEGIPAYNIYTYQGTSSHLGPGSAALASVFKYWNPDTNFLELKGGSELIALPLYRSLDRLAEVATENGYKASLQYLTLQEATQYLKDQKIPLIYALRPTEGRVFLEEPMTFPAVLIGIDAQANTVTFHDYWQGPTYTMSLSDFAARHGGTDSGGDKYEFLVVQPYNMEAALLNIATRDIVPYPDRTILMDLMKPLLDDYINGFFLSYAAGWIEDNDTAREENNRTALMYLDRLVARPEFETVFPKFFQVSTWHILATTYLDLGEPEKALQVLANAVPINEGLDVPEGQWPGVEQPTNAPGYSGVVSKVDRLFGDIYLSMGETDQAREAYIRALEIMPGNIFAQEGLVSLDTMQ